VDRSKEGKVLGPKAFQKGVTQGRKCLILGGGERGWLGKCGFSYTFMWKKGENKGGGGAVNSCRENDTKYTWLEGYLRSPLREEKQKAGVLYCLRED